MLLGKDIRSRWDSFAFLEKVGKLGKAQRILIFAGPVILLAGGFIFLFYLPKTTEITMVKTEISNLENKLLVAKRAVKNEAKIEATFKEATAQLKAALKLLPDKREIPSLLRNISNLGKDSRLEFPLFSPQGEKPKDFYVEIPVSIVLSGKYNDVAAFFDKVGGMARIVNIQGISMRPDKSMSTTLMTKCTATTYRFKSEAEIKAAKKAAAAKKKKKGR
jgi:type IV pilus assembly protein PilO